MNYLRLKYLFFISLFPLALYSQENTISKEKQQITLEKEFFDLLESGVKSGAISQGLKDSIINFVVTNNSLSPVNFSADLKTNRLNDTINFNKKVVYRDGQPIVVDDELNAKLYYVRKNLEESATKNIKNGINKSALYPDRLHIPTTDSKNRYEYQSSESLKNKMLSIDYFSKGIDGYYTKLIEMGYVGQGWEETKEARAAMDRLRESVHRNLQASAPATPDFLKKLRKSKNPLVQALAAILTMFNNGTKNSAFSDTPGYRNNNYLIKTPPVEPRKTYTNAP